MSDVDEDVLALVLSQLAIVKSSASRCLVESED